MRRALQGGNPGSLLAGRENWDGRLALPVGIDELRRSVQVFDGCNESFLERFTAEELIAIYRVHKRCAWDVYPSSWSERQVREALKGVVPQFRETPHGLVPVYAKRARA